MWSWRPSDSLLHYPPLERINWNAVLGALQLPLLLKVKVAAQVFLKQCPTQQYLRGYGWGEVVLWAVLDVVGGSGWPFCLISSSNWAEQTAVIIFLRENEESGMAWNIQDFEGQLVLNPRLNLNLVSFCFFLLLFRDSSHQLVDKKN